MPSKPRHTMENVGFGPMPPSPWNKSPTPKKDYDGILEVGDAMQVYVSHGSRRYLHIEIGMRDGDIKRHFRACLEEDHLSWEESEVGRNPPFALLHNEEMSFRLSSIAALFRGLVRKELGR